MQEYLDLTDPKSSLQVRLWYGFDVLSNEPVFAWRFSTSDVIDKACLSDLLERWKLTGRRSSYVTDPKFVAMNLLSAKLLEPPPPNEYESMLQAAGMI